jgi:hypothetical protein
MTLTLLERHLEQPPRFWVYDAYEGSMTPLGDDVYWALALDKSSGLGMFDIETYNAYYSELMYIVRLQGRWRIVESTEMYYIVAFDDPEVLVVEGQPIQADFELWEQYASSGKVGFRVTEQGITTL